MPQLYAVVTMKIPALSLQISDPNEGKLTSGDFSAVVKNSFVIELPGKLWFRFCLVFT